MDYPPKILALAHHDATVANALQTARLNGDDWGTTMENLVLMLGAEKKRLHDQLVKSYETAIRPAPILLPHGAKLLGDDTDTERPVSMPKLEEGSEISLNDFGTASGRYKVTKIKGDSLSLERMDG